MTRPLRIHWTYRTIDRPHGGANNFLRALRRMMAADPDFELVDRFESDFDVLFMNQLSSGPANGSRAIPLRTVTARLAQDGNRPKLVARAVNLRRESHPKTIAGYIQNRLFDHRVIALLNRADRIIYQSDYQRDVFVANGVRNRNAVRIYNGASDAFDVAAERRLGSDETLEIVATSIAPRLTKGQDLIARVAELPNVRVRFFGVWPAGIEPGKVVLEGVQDHMQLAAAYRRAHVLLHPALRDPCPNAVVEALHAGLPVIYRAGRGSSAELVGDAGLTLDPNDPAATVDEFRRRFSELAGSADAARMSHSIGRAYQEYKREFQSAVAATPPPSGLASRSRTTQPA